MFLIISHPQDSLPPLAAPAPAPANVFALTMFRYETPQAKLPQTEPPILAAPDFIDVAGTAHMEKEKRKKEIWRREKKEKKAAPFGGGFFGSHLVMDR